MSNELTIHVIGGGFGESIIIEFPNGSVGVIDCFCHSLTAVTDQEKLACNPTLRFLRARGVHELAFLAFTHPHNDHGRGLSHLLTDFVDHIGEIWIFEAFQEIYLERFYCALFESDIKLDIENLLNERAGGFRIELLKVRDHVLSQAKESKPNNALLRKFTVGKLFELEGENVRVRFIGPTDASNEDYRTKLIANLQSIIDDKGNLRDADWNPSEINHNLASPAILLEFGATRIVLGGDMEEAAWTRSLSHPDNGDLDLACNLVKVSHHGSLTGYTSDLYDRLSGRTKPIAVLTPFNRHSRPLPRFEGISCISQHASETWTTNYKCAQSSMGFEDPLTVDELSLFSEVLIRWQIDLERLPHLWGALDPSFVEQVGGRTGVPLIKDIPKEWTNDIIEKPRLIASARFVTKEYLLAGYKSGNRADRGYLSTILYV